MAQKQVRSSLTAVTPAAARPAEDTTNPFEAVKLFFDRAADHIHLADEMREVLRTSYGELAIGGPQDLIHLADEMREVLRTSYRELAVQVPVRMDGGILQVFR